MSWPKSRQMILRNILLYMYSPLASNNKWRSILQLQYYLPGSLQTWNIRTLYCMYLFFCTKWNAFYLSMLFKRHARLNRHYQLPLNIWWKKVIFYIWWIFKETRGNRQCQDHESISMSPKKKLIVHWLI